MPPALFYTTEIPQRHVFFFFFFFFPGPECFRMMEEFENVEKPTGGPTGHHETTPGLQCKVFKDVTSLTKVVSEMDNAFLAKIKTLKPLTHIYISNEVTTSLSQVQDVNQALHKVYVKTRVEKRIVPISDTIKRSSVYTFSNLPDPRKKSSKGGRDTEAKHSAHYAAIPVSTITSRCGHDKKF